MTTERPKMERQKMRRELRRWAGCWAALCAAVLAIHAAIVHGAEPELSETDFPRQPAVEPDRAGATFQVRPGFRMDLIASEPVVNDPVALSVDEAGRVYVVEMRDYSERRPERLGRVRRLEDRDGDGRYETSTIFLDQLPWPTAVVCYGGGVFVGSAPDIWYGKDTNGDGVAEVREVVFTGFSNDYAPYETNRLNVQALMNSFHWAWDNRIHGSASISGGRVRRIDSPFTRAWRSDQGVKDQAPSPEISLRGRDFSFDPRTLELRPESGGAQHGMTFDSAGRKFVCSNSDHLQLVMYGEGEAGSNPYYSLPHPRVSIAADGPAAEVFRRSPDEPWRVIRTRWRASGLVPGIVEGGGRPSGYFTGATGTTIYRGDAFGSDFSGDAFVADCGSNLVHRKRLRASGTLLIGERASDEQRTEFVASTDTWFRPVQFANAPDGCLWVLDMYRETIEHPWSIPANIKKHLDLNRGNDRGRLWRLTPEGFRGDPSRTRLGSNPADWVHFLSHPNGWHRDTASRLLFERRDVSVIDDVRRVARANASAWGKIHGLQALAGLGALNNEDLSHAMRDASPVVRQHAAFWMARTPAGPRSADLASGVRALAKDSDVLVRYALLLSMRSVPAEVRGEVMLELARRVGGDVWMQHLLLSQLTDADELPVWNELTQGDSAPWSAERATFTIALVREAGARGSDGMRRKVADGLARIPDDALRVRVADAWVSGEKSRAGARREASIVSSDGAWSTALDAARRVLSAPGDPGRGRDAAVRLVGELGGSAEDIETLLRWSRGGVGIGAGERSAAVRALLDRLPVEQSNKILGVLSRSDMELRGSVVADAFRSGAQGQSYVLDWIETGVLAALDLNPTQLASLRSAKDPTQAARALRLLGAPPESRARVLDRYLPALGKQGVATKGAEQFKRLCASCHRFRGEGVALGPDLESVAASGREKFFVGILDPNRETPPNFAAWTVERRDGESATGLLASETTLAVVLKQAGGVEWSAVKSDVKSMRTDGRSLMPEGLEESLSVEDFADLLEYLAGH